MQTEETQTAEPVDLPPVTGPYAEPWSLKKIIALASVFGPAAIVASVSIGAGETLSLFVQGHGRDITCSGLCFSAAWSRLFLSPICSVAIPRLAVNISDAGSSNYLDRGDGSSLRLSSLR